MSKQNPNLDWEWPLMALHTASAKHNVSGLVTPYDVLCWYDREGGRDQWQALNPFENDRLPPPGYFFSTADVVVATAQTWDRDRPGGTPNEAPTDAIVLHGRKKFEALVAGRLERPEDLKVVVVPVDLETDELHRLAVWVKFLRGRPGAETTEVPPPWAWDRHAGAKE
ncbi:MAG TPA: hypothetical protein VM597_06710 [Gemmataceae bacterium]|jgi:hypothetical protein|nr:hypothetical protein [Gemmataceae bacterium]